MWKHPTKEMIQGKDLLRSERSQNRLIRANDARKETSLVICTWIELLWLTPSLYFAHIITD